MKPEWRSKLILAVYMLLVVGITAQVSAKSGDQSYHQLKHNRASASFESITTIQGHTVIINANEHIVQPTNFFDMAGHSLRFAPTGQGAYHVSSPEIPFQEAFGEMLALHDDDSTKLSLEFPFPFYGVEYTEVYVNSDGNLTFGRGDAANRARDLENFLTGPPRIALLYADLDPFDPYGWYGTAVEVMQTPEQLTITWFNVPEVTMYDEVTMQVVLTNSGVIDIVYESSQVRKGLVGISPGGIAETSQVSLLDYSNDLPVEELAGAIAEVFVETPTVNLHNVAREFYRSYPDEFDSLVFFTNFESDLDDLALAFSVPVSNDVLGIGNPNLEGIFPLFDNSAGYGSQGRLKTLISMNNLKLWDDDPLENTYGAATSTLSVLAHEFGHIGGIFIDPPELRGRQDAHWSFFLHTGGSLMGGNDIRDNGDGSFTTLSPKDIYNPLDLYLMGLVAPEEVPSTFLVVEPHALDFPPPFDTELEFYSAAEARLLDPMGDVTFYGQRKDISIEDIITLNGARIPDANESHQEFRVGFILLTQGEATPPSEEIEKVEMVRRYWSPYFERAVGDRATMRTTLDGSFENTTLPDETQPEGVLRFTVDLNAGLNFLSPPLRPMEPFTARSFMEFVGSTVVIGVSEQGRFVSWTIETPGDGFAIEGGRGYIVNTPAGGTVQFAGEAWTDPTEESPLAAPSVINSLWAFAVDGLLTGQSTSTTYQVMLENRSTGLQAVGEFRGGERFSLAWGDLGRNAVVSEGDLLRLSFTDAATSTSLGHIDRVVTEEHLRQAYLLVGLDMSELAPHTSLLLPNYPNPFNPETWIPYRLATASRATIQIIDVSGHLVRTLDLGQQPAGYYDSKPKAAYWDGRNALGEQVSSGVYFYRFEAGGYTAIRKLMITR